MRAPKGLTVRERFVWMCRPTPSGCWEWMGYRNDRGYGVMVIDKQGRKAHRVSVELHGRTIPEGNEVDHLCRNRACVNPWHLDLVTRAENNRRKLTPTICPRGHAKTDDNVYIEKGRRHCRTCTIEAARRQRAA